MQPYREYLVGEKIDTGLKVQMSRLVEASENDLLGRNTFLTKLVQGGSVVHIGCADHLEVIKSKMVAGKYLHALLVDACPKVVGVDSNIEGLKAMKELGFDPKSLFTNNELDELEGDFTFALIPDVIEHVHDVGSFLQEMKNLNVNKFVFSTPNGLSLSNRFLIKSECVNSDHISSFTPYTLAKSLAVAGYKLEEIYLVDLFWKRRPIRSLLLKYFPILREHLIVVVSKGE